MWAFMGRWASTNHVDLRDKQGLKQAEQAWDDYLEAQCSCSDPKYQGAIPIEQECTTITNCEICGTLSTEPLCTTCQVLYPETTGN